MTVYVEDLIPHVVVQDEVATAGSSTSSSELSSSDKDETRTIVTDDTRDKTNVPCSHDTRCKQVLITTPKLPY